MQRIRFGLVLSILLLMGQGCLSQAPEQLEETPNQVTEEPIEEVMTEQPTYEFPGELPAERIENKQVRLVTERGEIVFELYPDTAPLAVSNFVYLAEQGYYDGLIFHRVVPEFVIQGGDPTGTGAGGPGYTFEDELGDDRTYDKGIVAMANRGPDTNGSQFFIMLKDYSFDQLAKAYTIFGNVTEGIEVVDAIGMGDKIVRVVIEPLGGEEAAEGEEEAGTDAEAGEADAMEEEATE